MRIFVRVTMCECEYNTRVFTVYFKIEYLNEEAAEMNENERNALRYVAGYVCHKLRTKLERENHELKEEMILCLMDLVKNTRIHMHMSLMKNGPI